MYDEIHRNPERDRLMQILGQIRAMCDQHDRSDYNVVGDIYEIVKDY